MKIALVVITLLAAAFGLWRFEARRNAASAERLARVLRADPRKVEPSTRALLLLETIPTLRKDDREVAVQRLRATLAAIPRRIIAHRPAVPVEAIRFSGMGRTVLWYGKAADGIRIELWTERATNVASFSSPGSGATFLDEAGTLIFKDEDPRLETVMSRDGDYVSRVEDGFLAIWGVRDIADRPGGERPLFLAAVPYATTRLHCVRPAGICGMDALGRLTLIDVNKSRIVRSIAVERTATVHMSPSGRLVGVASPRGGLTIHDARTVRVDTPRLADFAFSADEKSVVALDREGGLRSYDVVTGKPGARSPEQWKNSSHVETAGDGRFLVWGAEQVRLVSADLSTVAARFDEGGEVSVVKTNKSGDRLAIARRTGPFTLWDISPKPALPLIESELLEVACDRIGRPLTTNEWATYFPNRRYAPRCR